MDNHEKISAIQTIEFPAFIAALEAKYGKAFMENNFAIMGSLAVGGGSGMFETFGCGKNNNVLCLGHAIVRSLAKAEVAASNAPTTPAAELNAIRSILSALWVIISKDIGREGVPDSIFEGFMQNKQEANLPTTPNDNAPTQ